MAYGFNDDKSKTKVCGKDEIVVIDGLINDVPAKSAKYITLTKSELERDYGIDNIYKYVPISIEYAEFGHSTWHSHGTSIPNTVYTYSGIRTSRYADGKLNISCSNMSDESYSYKYKIVFARLL